MSQDQECYNRAKVRGQRTFTLVEQDFLAVGTIGEWIKAGLLAGVPRMKLHAALDDACDMRESTVRKKVPD